MTVRATPIEGAELLRHSFQYSSALRGFQQLGPRVVTSEVGGPNS